MMSNLIRDLFGRDSSPTKLRFGRHRHLPLDELTNVRLHDILSPLIERNPATQTFEVVRELMWAENSHPPIRPVLAFKKFKGGALFLDYGLSVDFVPVIAGKRAIMRRGTKGAKFDVIFDPCDQQMSVSFMYGTAAALADAHRVLPVVLAKALPFWSQHQTVAKLAEAVRLEEDQSKKGGRGVECYVQARFARPFLLVAAGETERALQIWKSELGRAGLDETGRRKAQAQFDVVMGQDFSTEWSTNHS